MNNKIAASWKFADCLYAMETILMCTLNFNISHDKYTKRRKQLHTSSHLSTHQKKKEEKSQNNKQKNGIKIQCVCRDLSKGEVGGG